MKGYPSGGWGWSSPTSSIGLAWTSGRPWAAKSGEKDRPHVLVMSATPIPRTLALMIYGDLDLSVIDQLPPGRTPVATYLIREDKRARLYAFVRKQVAQGRQVYIVCPAVDQEDPEGLKAAEQYGRQLQEEVFPDLRVGIVHGKQKARDKQGVMAAFAAGEVDVLVSTTVIEVGVDVPNASLMVVEDADRFGLSQLHQLRGRGGAGGAPILLRASLGQPERADPKAAENPRLHHRRVCHCRGGLEAPGPWGFLRRPGSMGCPS